jgi:hypothetical protein
MLVFKFNFLFKVVFHVFATAEYLQGRKYIYKLPFPHAAYISTLFY